MLLQGVVERLLWIALTGDESQHQEAIHSLAEAGEPRLSAAARAWKVGDLAAFERVEDDRLLWACIRLVDEGRSDAAPAALVLGVMADPRAFDCLIRALSSSQPWVREAAARGLQRLGNPLAIPALRRLRMRSAWIDAASGVAAACDRAIRALEAIQRAHGREMVPAEPWQGRGTELAPGGGRNGNPRITRV